MQRPPAHLCAAENMRREGFELSVSPPRVVLREEEGGSRCCLAMQGAGAASVPPLLHTAVAAASLPLQLPSPPKAQNRQLIFRSPPLAGKKLEPLEEVVCEVEDQRAGEVIEAVSLRKGEVRGLPRLIF